MIEKLVERFPGDSQGPDIVDPLIRSLIGAECRGQAEIDVNGYDRMLVAGRGPLRGDHIEPGALVENADMESPAWRGVVERSAITIEKSGDSFSASLALEIERVEVGREG